MTDVLVSTPSFYLREGLEGIVNQKFNGVISNSNKANIANLVGQHAL